MADTKKQGLCIVCKENQTSRHCAHCGNDFICSKDCEEYMMGEGDPPEHAIACEQCPKTTADEIHKAVVWDELPTDPQAIKDYGFNRCYTFINQGHLLAVYHTLFVDFRVTARELDIWMKEKKLYQRICAQFAAEPELVAPVYFKWFKENRRVWDLNDPNGLPSMTTNPSPTSQEVKREKQKLEAGKSVKPEVSLVEEQLSEKLEEGSTIPVKKEAVAP